MTLNSLQLFIIREGIPETEAMNRLQSSGIVSDNCVTVRDVADGDCSRAVEFLAGK